MGEAAGLIPTRAAAQHVLQLHATHVDNQNSYIGNDSFAANLGIGTTTPTEKLTVVGNTIMAIASLVAFPA